MAFDFLTHPLNSEENFFRSAAGLTTISPSLFSTRSLGEKGVSGKLLDKALDWFDVLYTYAFVEPENTVARELFASNFKVSITLVLVSK